MEVGTQHDGFYLPKLRFQYKQAVGSVTGKLRFQTYYKEQMNIT